MSKVLPFYSGYCTYIDSAYIHEIVVSEIKRYINIVFIDWSQKCEKNLGFQSLKEWLL